MKNQQEGIVIELSEKIAIVKVVQHGDCENCGSCAGNNAQTVKVNNCVGAKKGDKVIFEADKKGMLRVVFIIFWLPLILSYIGSTIGLWTSSYLKGSSLIYQMVGGFLAFTFSIAIIIYFEKKSKSDMKRLPIIVKSMNAYS